jgi:hypothetical protein
MNPLRKRRLLGKLSRRKEWWRKAIATESEAEGAIALAIHALTAVCSIFT